MQIAEFVVFTFQIDYTAKNNYHQNLSYSCLYKSSNEKSQKILKCSIYHIKIQFTNFITFVYLFSKIKNDNKHIIILFLIMKLLQ
jgi:hypothetical protein